MTNIEDQIRFVLRSQADAMHVPEARPGEHLAHIVPMPTRRHRARPWIAAAAAIAVVLAGIALVHRRGEPPAAATSPFHFETPTVRLDASSVEVVIGDQTFEPTSDVRVDGDPGMPNEHTTLELTWHHRGIEQRIDIYFASDGIDWWANEIRTYNGQTDGDWVEPPAQGEYFKSRLGTAYVGDLDLPNLRIHRMTLEAFLRPAACEAATTPIALIADYPTIDSFSLGGFGASFQLLDTTTCTAIPVGQYTFEYTSEDPTVAAVAVPQLDVPDDPPTKTRLDLQLVAPGATTIHATAKDAAGNVVSTIDVQVTVHATDQPGPNVAPATPVPSTVANR